MSHAVLYLLITHIHAFCTSWTAVSYCAHRASPAMLDTQLQKAPWALFRCLAILLDVHGTNSAMVIFNRTARSNSTTFRYWMKERASASKQVCYNVHYMAYTTLIYNRPAFHHKRHRDQIKQEKRAKQSTKYSQHDDGLIEYSEVFLEHEQWRMWGPIYTI